MVTNWGDRTNVAIAFNEQVLLARHRLNAIEDDAILLVENMWATHKDEDIRAEWVAAMEELGQANSRIIEVPMEQQCLTIVDDARRGKNMFVLGMLCAIYRRDVDTARNEIAKTFKKKSEKVIKINHDLFDAGYTFARENIDYAFEIPASEEDRLESAVVMNGNTAAGLGVFDHGSQHAVIIT